EAAFDREAWLADVRRSLSRLATLRAWLTVESPSDRGGFPYQFMLQDRTSGELIAGGTVLEGSGYQGILQRSSDWSGGEVGSRYAYVFSIDRNGRRTLLFPGATDGNGENLVPTGEPTDSPPPTIALGAKPISVAPPFGTETLVLLTSERPLSDPRSL